MTTKAINVHVMELFLVYTRNPSIKLRNQLVELNRGLVRKVAYKISKQCAEPYEDLEQIGYLGLIRAVERFNPHQGFAFSSFAIPYIRGEMLHYLRDKSNILKIPRRWQEIYNKAKKIRKTLTANLGYPPKETQVAHALGISFQEWNECQLAFKNRLLISLDITLNSNNDCFITVADTIADSRSQAKQKYLEEQLQLEGAINQLNDKSKVVIEWVYLKNISRKEVAKQIGISPMTVTRHIKQGIKELETILEAQVA